MDRVIKFRGLAIVNDKRNKIKVGDFVYGSYIESGCDAPCIIFGDGEQIEIDKNTLGQLTGLTDNKGNGYYSGDIGQFDNGDKFVIRQEDWLELYADWIGEPECEDQTRDFYRIRKAKIIGNIHQNKELLDA